MHKSWHWISSTSGGRSVGIVRSRTKGHGVFFFFLLCRCRVQKAVRFPPNIWSGGISSTSQYRGLCLCMVTQIWGVCSLHYFSIWKIRKSDEMRLGRPRRRCVGNIKMDLIEAWYGDLDWTGLTQDRKKYRALWGDNEPSSSIKCLETIEWLHCWWPLE
jgi:hypothetical protein